MEERYSLQPVCLKLPQKLSIAKAKTERQRTAEELLSLFTGGCLFSKGQSRSGSTWRAAMLSGPCRFVKNSLARQNNIVVDNKFLFRYPVVQEMTSALKRRLEREIMYHKRFSGTHYKAGYRYGSMLKKHGVIIDKSLTFNITEEMKGFAADCLKEYERYYPEILEEIRGMSEGQGSSFNRLCQILFCMYCFKPDHHCTCFAAVDKENILFGRNSDFLVSLEKLYMNCLYRLEGAYAFHGNTTAFIEMEDGMNEHGLAIGLTFVYPHNRKPGINAGMLVRYILEKCKTTAEAAACLEKLPVASAQTLTIADSGGKIAVAECNAQAMEILYPENGKSYVAAVNHFHLKRLQKFKTPETIDDWRSEDRYKTVKTALEKYKGRYSVEFAQKLLAGEYGFICQYDRKKNADTVWSVVYDVKNRKIYRAEGNPSRKRFLQDDRMPFAAVRERTANE